VNDTAASLMIHPKVRLGVMSFQSIAQGTDADHFDDVPADPNDIPVRTVYKAVRPGTRDRAQAL
jgi:hypothetical protein